jgi:pimeloyl-ACP methyl ester carboxylesterase
MPADESAEQKRQGRAQPLPERSYDEPHSPLRPAWFDWAVGCPLTAHQVDVEGCEINYLRWGHSGDDASDDADSRADSGSKLEPTTEVNSRFGLPGLLFIHGGGAHARWWQFLAPFFSADFDVAAIDLSGMGDSGHRSNYHSDQRGREVRAVLEHLRFGRDTYVVGHSLGGFIGMRFAAAYGERVAGMVIVDSPISPPGAPAIEPPPDLPPHKFHPSRAAAMSRFRVLPSQPCENDFILKFIAQHSVREMAQGWQWKFDAKGMGQFSVGPRDAQCLASMRCPGALIYGERSALVNKDTAVYMGSLMGPQAPTVAVPDAYHHVMLDQPLAFVSALRSILALWRMRS